MCSSATGSPQIGTMTVLMDPAGDFGLQDPLCPPTSKPWLRHCKVVYRSITVKEKSRGPSLAYDDFEHQDVARLMLVIRGRSQKFVLGV